MKSTVRDFVNCASLAKEAGYDGVEIMGSEGYLINQFLVTKTNQRSDEYGGESFTNRMRLAVEIVSETRKACGLDFIIIFRLSMLDLVEDGSSWEEIKALAQALEDAGVTGMRLGFVSLCRIVFVFRDDALDKDLDSPFVLKINILFILTATIATSVPRGAFSWVTKKLRDENIVSIPLCATNRIQASCISGVDHLLPTAVVEHDIAEQV